MGLRSQETFTPSSSYTLLLNSPFNHPLFPLLPHLATFSLFVPPLLDVIRADPEALRRAHEEGRFLDAIPINHSPFNAPLIHPTLETGIHALSLAALSALNNKKND